MPHIITIQINKDMNKELMDKVLTALSTNKNTFLDGITFVIENINNVEDMHQVVNFLKDTSFGFKTYCNGDAVLYSKNDITINSEIA